jgi:FkbM family methyltransferase
MKSLIRKIGWLFRPRKLAARIKAEFIYREADWLSRAYEWVKAQQMSSSSFQMEKIGSKYGGWIVPIDQIRDNWVCYCGGVGEDITFDLGLIERFHCQVFAFDPTPRSIAHVTAHARDIPGFHFMPVGLWSKNKTLRFFAPLDSSHVSHSIVNLHGTTSYFEAQCRSITSIMKKLGHTHIDLLKIDIEGAEHTVIRSMLADGIQPRVLCIEIDRPVKALRFHTTMRRIFRAGYNLIAVDGWNFTFMKA